MPVTTDNQTRTEEKEFCNIANAGSETATPAEIPKREITAESAAKLKHGDWLYHHWHKGPDTRPVRCRVSGKIKIRPKPFCLMKVPFEIPVTCRLVPGVKYITNTNAPEWYIK